MAQQESLRLPAVQIQTEHGDIVDRVTGVLVDGHELTHVLTIDVHDSVNAPSEVTVKFLARSVERAVEQKPSVVPKCDHKRARPDDTFEWCTFALGHDGKHSFDD